MLAVHFIVHTVSLVAYKWGHHLAQNPAPTATPAASGSDPGGTALNLGNFTGFLQNVAKTLFSMGLFLCVIGIIVGGIMRATAFGSERRIMTSNVALSCAVLGFIIIMLAKPVGLAIQGAFK